MHANPAGSGEESATDCATDCAAFYDASADFDDDATVTTRYYSRSYYNSAIRRTASDLDKAEEDTPHRCNTDTAPSRTKADSKTEAIDCSSC